MDVSAVARPDQSSDIAPAPVTGVTTGLPRLPRSQKKHLKRQEQSGARSATKRADQRRRDKLKVSQRTEMLAAMNESERRDFILAERAEDRAMEAHLQGSFASGTPTFVVNCSFCEGMVRKEIVSLRRQIGLCYEFLKKQARAKAKAEALLAAGASVGEAGPGVCCFQLHLTSLDATHPLVANPDNAQVYTEQLSSRRRTPPE